MSPDARREMIVEHALPLLIEHGAGVTTQLIAQVAGIGEATLFRAFEDKSALLRACMKQTLRPEPLVAALEGVPRDLPLPERLETAANLMSGHARRSGQVMEALMVAGVRLHRDDLAGKHDLRKAMVEGRERSMAVISDAIGDLMAPDSARFRVPVHTAATTFQFLVMSLMRRPFGGADDHDRVGGLDVAGVVDLFLHGALSETVPAEALQQKVNGEDIAC